MVMPFLVLVAAAGADGDDLALRGLLLGAVGNDNAALSLLFGGDSAHDDAVMQGTKLGLGHGFLAALARMFLLESVGFLTP